VTAQEPVRLIPLTCVRCQAPVPARLDEVAWVCQQCDQGLLIDDRQGARALDVFFSSRLRPGSQGRPFWVASGEVTIQRRETYQKNEGRAAQQFWSSPRLFYVPAWATGLEEVVSTGVELLKNPEPMQPGAPMPFLPVVTLPVDLQALAEFIIFSIEAERRDALKRVDFALTLQPPQLWIMP
jgi:hypothetical protein